MYIKNINKIYNNELIKLFYINSENYCSKFKIIKILH